MAFYEHEPPVCLAISSAYAWNGMNTIHSKHIPSSVPLGFLWFSLYILQQKCLILLQLFPKNVIQLAETFVLLFCRAQLQAQDSSFRLLPGNFMLKLYSCLTQMNRRVNSVQACKLLQILCSLRTLVPITFSQNHKTLQWLLHLPWSTIPVSRTSV